jgi:hypothetical protein
VVGGGAVCFVKGTNGASIEVCLSHRLLSKCSERSEPKAYVCRTVCLVNASEAGVRGGFVELFA